MKTTIKSNGVKLGDRIREWLDELLPVVQPVPCPIPVKDDRRGRRHLTR
jgi:hypothetical protein